MSVTEKDSQDVDSGNKGDADAEGITTDDDEAAASVTRTSRTIKTLTSMLVSEAMEEEEAVTEDNQISMQQLSLQVTGESTNENGYIFTDLLYQGEAYSPINILSILASSTEVPLDTNQFQQQVAWLQDVPIFTIATLEIVIPVFLITEVIDQGQDGYLIYGVLNTDTKDANQDASQISIQVDAQGQFISFMGSSILGTSFSVEQQPTAAPGQTDATGGADNTDKTGDTGIPEEAGDRETKPGKDKQKAAAVNSNLTGNKETEEGDEALTEQVEKINMEYSDETVATTDPGSDGNTGTEDEADQIPPPEEFESNEAAGNVNTNKQGNSTGQSNVPTQDQHSYLMENLAGAAIDSNYK